MRKLCEFIAALALLLIVTGCGGGGGGGTAATTVVRSADLTGSAENPSVMTMVVGRSAVVVDPTTMEITGGITFNGLTPSRGDITSIGPQSGIRRFYSNQIHRQKE